ncbi:short-chain dehydrogenase, putative [Talaromyces marneffei ATCC 18224]|uniref:Short-chain dehydrogenase, putative n=1 Tax=Talaromyces marneffei (strain ATCC 18224 / CBS 334.59 / QM 7333) TaxID=441960 RepID=B6Q876_TALMQ|nr:short-chain dehydrogenase, putative [Talaromyces marneffei ATCC 18224]
MLQKWDIVSEIPSLHGKVANVTGAKSLGKADNAIKKMQEDHPSLARDDLLRPLPLELGDLQNINAVAAKFASEEERLDILVNNAALLARPLDLDKNGISVSFATNHLAPFRLTTALLPLLKRTAEKHSGVRIVNVGSDSHLHLPAGIQLNNISDFNQSFGSTDSPESNLSRYALSKLVNHLFSAELQRRLDVDQVPIVTVGLHPGYVLTDGANKNIDKYHADIRDNIESISLSPLDGALTTIFAAAHPEVWEKRHLYGGAYVEPYGSIEQSSEDARDLVLAANLWKSSEDVLQNIAA